MKPHAERALEWGKQTYAGVFADSEKKEIAEAIALGVDQSTAHNYLDVDATRYLPFGLVPNSLFARQLTEALCEKIGGAFIQIHGHLNGTDSDERKTILACMARMQKESDPRKIETLYTEIENAAARARKESK